MATTTFQTQINDYKRLDIISDDNNIYHCKKDSFSISELKVDNDSISFRIGSKLYEFVVIERDGKFAKISYKGGVYEINLFDELDLFIEKIGLKIQGNARSDKEVYSSMPGNIIHVLVEEGDEVKKGDNLLVLEAMKMENIISSNSGFKVKKIHVTKGQSVEKNTLMIEGE